jgi:hypothetical protein
MASEHPPRLVGHLDVGNSEFRGVHLVFFSVVRTTKY